VLLSARPDQPPAAVERVWVERYAGLHGPEDFVRWQSLPERTLRTYEVWQSESPDGPFTRVDSGDGLYCGWLQPVEPGKTYHYRVRAADYWGRVGENSSK
jgi:hypothetical protein